MITERQGRKKHLQQIDDDFNNIIKINTVTVSNMFSSYETVYIHYFDKLLDVYFTVFYENNGLDTYFTKEGVHKPVISTEYANVQVLK